MTQKIVIQGGRQLYGDVVISGMKNAALPILFATILVHGTCTLENIPNISDIATSLKILEEMGADIRMVNRTTYQIDTARLEQGSAPADLVRRLRGSSYLLGAELGRFGKATTGWPGGCELGGARPLDLHFKGFNALGAKETFDNGVISVVADENGLKGNSVYFDIASVGATVNVMLAAVLTPGLTVLDNAAREPHIVDLANFLNTCGANISGAGTPVIKIRGVEELHGCTYTIIPDMIEAGTYMVAAAATGGRVLVRSVIPKHVETVTAKLLEMGVTVQELDDSVIVEGNGQLKSINIKTLPYPGFPTDMHPQFAPLLCLADGISTVQENVWERRFRYAQELIKMGATIIEDARTATFVGCGHLTGAPVNATDLRGGAALVVAGLAADGITEISGIDYIARGYCDIVKKLQILGASVSTVNVPDVEDTLMKAN